MSVKSKSWAEMTLQERAAELEMDVEELEHASRPFNPAVEEQARQIVSRYKMYVEWVEDEQRYFAGCEEYGYLCGDGPTRAAAIDMATEGMVGAVACTLDGGETPPVPLADAPPHEPAAHVDVVVSKAELSDLEDAARREGFRGVGDYLRHAALAGRR